MDIKLPEGHYTIRNVVRRSSSRARRYAAPGRQRFKQYVCGKRLLRKQTVNVSHHELERDKKAVFSKVVSGALELVMPNGAVVFADQLGQLMMRQGQQVSTFQMIKPAAASTPQPAPPKAVDKPVEKRQPVENPPARPAAQPDDLTALPNIGPGRAKKLEAAGITTFEKLSSLKPAGLAKLIGSPFTEDMATEACGAAVKRKEG